MKKHTLCALLIAGFAAFTVTGCGGNSKPAETTAEETTRSEEPVSQKNQQETESEAEDVTDDGSVKPVRINVEEINDNYNDYSGTYYNQAVTSKYFKLHLADGYAEKYPGLQAAFDSYNTDAESNAAYNFEDMKESYETEKQYRSDDYQLQLSSETSAYVQRADSLVTSIRSYWYSYWGGAHGEYESTGLNYDSSTGNKLALSDVVIDKDKFIELVADKYRTEYSDLYDGYTDPDPASYLRDTDFTNPEVTMWTVSNEGVTVYFSVYTLGPYAMGSQNITVYFDEAPEIFESKYTEHCADYVMPMDQWEQNIDVDVDGDGSREPIRLEDDYSTDGYSYAVHVKVGNVDITADPFVYSNECYLVHSGGRYYVYVFGVSDSDYSQLSVVDLATRSCNTDRSFNAYLCDLQNTWSSTDDSSYSSGAVKTAFTDPSEFLLGKRSDFLGTKSCYRKYHTGSDGYPVSDDKYYIEETSNAVRAINDVPCEISDADGNAVSKGSIPAGSYAIAVRSDEENFVDLQLVDESQLDIIGESEWKSYSLKSQNTDNIDYSAKFYRIKYDASDWPGKINGTDEDQVFDGIVYAG